MRIQRTFDRNPSNVVEWGNGIPFAARIASHVRTAGPPLFILVLLSAVSPLATDLYTPAFPAMAVSLVASEASIQLTFSAFIIGMGVGQFLVGPISDGVGRRPFLIAGTVLFVVFSVLCALADSASMLILWRLLLGFSGAACIVMARATISDVFTPELAGPRFATVAAIQSIAPVIGPMVGAVILIFGDWRTIFFVIAGIGLVMVVGVLALMPESLPKERRSGVSLRDNGHRVRDLLRNRPFIGYVATSCLACAGFFTYIAGAPLVLHSVFGLSEQQYGLFFAVNALGMAAMISVLRLLSRRMRTERLLVIGLIIAVVFTAALLVQSVLQFESLAGVWICLFGLTCSIGFVNPSGLILSQRAGRVHAGTAAALHGGLQFTSGALASPITGVFGHSTLLPMAVAMFTFMVLALVSNRIGTRLNGAAAR